MVKYWDGTSKYEEWFEGARWTVYKERLFVVVGFSFLPSLHVPLYSKASYNFETTPIVVLFCLSRYEHRVPCSDYDITFLLLISPTPKPAHYNFCLQLKQHRTYYQPGEELQFTEQSRSTLWEETSTHIQENSQSAIPIKRLNNTLWMVVWFSRWLTSAL